MAFKNAILIAILAVIVIIPSKVLARDFPAKACPPPSGAANTIEDINQIGGADGLGRRVTVLEGGKQINPDCRNLCCFMGQNVCC
ncbi:hypothetical protein HN51_000580 [Arachis hypogaea]|nr:uncharacterized protein DS421_1g06290 [Arachis hypogaea]